MAKQILSVATAGLAGVALKGAAKAVGIGGKKKPAETPAAGPVVMPLADDDAVMRARRAALARQRSGRTSTMLTDSTDTLGG